MQGRLGQARLHLQVNVGFGDMITPEREERDYPTLLRPACPAAVDLPAGAAPGREARRGGEPGMTNTRVKDLRDVACLARRFAFNGETLRTAIEETLQRRRPPSGGNRPVALLPGYYLDGTRGQRWRGPTGPDWPAGPRTHPAHGHGRRAAALPEARMRLAGHRLQVQKLSTVVSIDWRTSVTEPPRPDP